MILPFLLLGVLDMIIDKMNKKKRLFRYFLMEINEVKIHQQLFFE